MKKRNILLSGLILITPLSSWAQDKDKWGFEKKHTVSTQLFVLFTPILDPSPEYFQLNYGFRPSAKDEISFEAITWTYRGPQGRPYGPDHENATSDFPGDIKAFGAGLAYKRLLWKGIFAQVHATAFRQDYRDENKRKIQSGFQLFNTLRFGYHFKLLKKRWFLAPSIAFTTWPINTNLPASFQVEEDKWSSYFLFEPGLHIGYTF